MPPATLPSHEQHRLAAMRSYCQLDGRRDDWHDGITRVVSALTGCPIALVSIVDRDRQWFKGATGLKATGTPREQSFCAYSVLSGEPLVVEDATQDARFSDNPLVTGELGIRFYAGVPLVDAAGFVLGSLCAIDTVPRQVDEDQLDAMRVLAGVVVEHLTARQRASDAERESLDRRAELMESEAAKARLEAELRRREALEAALADQASAREAAERITRHQQMALDSAGIVGITDGAGKITYVNDNFCRVSGYAREELLGQNHRMLNSGHHPRSFFTNMFASMRRGTPWRGEICNRSKSGELYWVDTTIVPVLDGSGRVSQYISLRVEITDRKRAEAELERARQEAEAASRAKSEFLAHMSHEIRTPLTAVMGFADLLRTDEQMASDPVQRAAALDTIRSAGEHLLGVINDILDVSKVEAGRMELERVVISPRGVLAEVESLMRPRAIMKGVELRMDVDRALSAPVMGDPTRVRQVVMNLVGNAIKFTSRGWVSVWARTRADDAGGSWLVLDVEDTGPGMDAAQAGKLFQSFAQGDASMTRRHGGTGLGLSISRSLAELMGGTVRLVRSAPGEGSCFRFEMPLHPAQAAPGQPTAPTPDAAPPVDGHAGTIRLSGCVLLVEDGRENQRLISYYLTKAGAAVDVAEHGEAALELIARSPGRYALVLTDVQMPVMDGHTLTRTLRARGCATPIVALTAHAMAEEHHRCFEAGCDDVATKPVDRAALLGLCGRWMGRRSEHRAVRPRTGTVTGPVAGPGSGAGSGAGSREAA